MQPAELTHFFVAPRIILRLECRIVCNEYGNNMQVEMVQLNCGYWFVNHET